MKQMIVTALALVSLGLAASRSEARHVRAQDMNRPEAWMEALKKARPGDTVEFRQGDEIPVSVQAKGDLIESTNNEVTYVRVKKSFWLRLSEKSVQISFDEGRTYREFSDALTGSLQANAGSEQSGHPTNAIQIIFDARLKGATHE